MKKRYLMMLKVTIIVVKKRTMSPDKNKTSASFSNRLLVDSASFLMARKEKIQLLINSTMATAVVSSIILTSPILDTLMEVSTIKQRPSRLAEVLSMCGDLLSAILFLFFEFDLFGNAVDLTFFMWFFFSSQQYPPGFQGINPVKYDL
jgi:hypothetical protein